MSEEQPNQNAAIIVETDGGHQVVGEWHGRADADDRAILLHGGGQSRLSWKNTAALLSDHGWSTFAYDARGHGESEWRRDGDYRIAELARDLTVVLDRFPGRPPVLVGASMGGMTSLIYAAQPGVRVRGLVLVDIAPRMDEHETRRIEQFMRSNLDGFDTLEAAQDAVHAYNPLRPKPPSLDGLRRIMRHDANGRWFWRWDPTILQNATEAAREAMPIELFSAARKVSVPVLVVRGLQSTMVSDEAIAELAAVIPDVRHADIAEAGHMVAGDDNDQFGNAVLEFLRSLR